MFGEIRNEVGELLDYSFALGAEKSASPLQSHQLVVIGHGVTANKDRAWAKTLASALQAAGFASLRFSFAGNGDSEGSFGASCPTKEAADLTAVLNAVENSTQGKEEDWQVTFVGHSMGGAVGVMVASHDPRLQRLISLAGMVDTATFAQRKFGDLTAGRDCMWEKPECPLSEEFLRDMQQVESVAPLVSAVRIPWLLIHGTEDTVVPLEESERVQKLAPSAQLITMQEVDHVFTDSAAIHMADFVVDWLLKA